MEDDKIRQRAHELWEQEGRPEGRATDHWTRAQQELDGAPEEAAADRETGDPAAAASAAAVTGVDVGNAPETTPADVEQSLLAGDDAPTPYLNAETGRAKRK